MFVLSLNSKFVLIYHVYSIPRGFFLTIFLFLYTEFFLLLFISPIIALEPNNAVNIKIIFLKGSLGYKNNLTHLNNSQNFLFSSVFFTKDLGNLIC